MSVATVRAVSRAVAVLRSFTAERPALALAEIAQAAALDKATTRRLLLTLIDEGMVRQDPASQRYALALGMLALSAGVQTGGLREEARPVMAALARESGVTVFLSVPDQPGALCLERMHGADPVQVRWWGVGQHMAWDRGAAPRLLLAHMAPEHAGAALRRIQAPAAHATDVVAEDDVDRVLKMLPAVRDLGYAIATDDVAVGLSAIAVPVRDGRGEVIGSLSLGGLTRIILDHEDKPRALDRLRASAAEISAHLP